MATNASAKPPAPRLNVPPAMAGALRLDPVASPSRLLEIPKTPSPSKTTYSDRFIPCRSSSRLHNFALLDRPSPSKDADAPDTPYSRLLRAELFGPDSPAPAAAGAPSSPNTNLFRFKTDHSAPFATAATAGQQDCTAGSGEASTPHKPPRKVPKTPHKVLDAPSLQDDFYLNLVDWSSQNMLAVGLGTCVYLWSASNSKVTKLCDLGPRDSVCAVQWTREGSYLAIGTGLGDVQIWDSSRCKRIRNMGGHQTRAGVLAWSSCILSSGSRDKSILQHDIRVPSDYISKFSGHRSEVCGLKWSHDDRELASGGNDNQLLVWNQCSQQPVLRLTEHTAAVKAITWSPHQQGLLASGGGTADRCIRFWNTANGNMLNSIDTGSQVYTPSVRIDGMVLNISAISPPSVRIDATVDLDVTVNVLDFGEIVPVACISVSVVLIFLKNLFVPYVNSYLAQGFPLPIIKGFSIRDAYILTSNSRIIVSSDVAFIEPEVIYIPCLNQ